MVQAPNGTNGVAGRHRSHSTTDPDHRRPAPLPSASALNVRPEINLLKSSTQRTPNSLVIGTRASALALTQAYLVQATLASLFPEYAAEFSIAPMSSAGDRNKVQPLYLMGGKALWTQELEVALVEGGIDLIVHSMKDVPTSLPDGCQLGAILSREDPRDCLVVKQGLPYKTLEDLPAGSVVGTSSVRRVAQLRRAFPKLLFADVRGNIDTRLSKVDDANGPFTAIILAAAGLIRLNLTHRITSFLSSPQMLYAVGQGALAIETRTNDPRVARMINKLDDWQTSWRCRAEREMLRTLEGGCSVPVGCETMLSDIQEETNGEGSSTSRSASPSSSSAASSNISALLTLHAIVASLAGDRAITTTISRRVSCVEEAEAVGLEAAEDLIGRGGKQILEELGRTIEDQDFAKRHEEAVKRAMDKAAKGKSTGQLPIGEESLCGVSPVMRTHDLPPIEGTGL